MTCREATEFLTDYVDGVLPEPLRQNFERHLSRCPKCPGFLAQFKRTVEATRRAYQRVGPDAEADLESMLPEDVVATILASVTKE